LLQGVLKLAGLFEFVSCPAWGARLGVQTKLGLFLTPSSSRTPPTLSERIAERVVYMVTGKMEEMNVSKY